MATVERSVGDGFAVTIIRNDDDGPPVVLISIGAADMPEVPDA